MATEKRFTIRGDARVGGAVQGSEKVAESIRGVKTAAKQARGEVKDLGLQMEINAARAKNAAAAKQRVLDKLQKFTPGMSQAAGATGGLNKNLLASATRLAKFGGAAGLAVAGVVALHGKISDLAEESARVQNVFDNLAISIEPARRATGGLISDMDLATKANQAMSLGVVKSARDFGELAGAAQKLGARINLGPVEALDSLLAGVGRGSTEMLDNLGIVLKMEQAHREYATQLGKTVKELTQAEKAEAFRKVAIQKIIEAAKDVTITTDASTDAVRRFNVELENIRTRALGGTTNATVSLKDAMVELRKEGLVPSEAIAEKYGLRVVQVRGMLREMGVASEELSGITENDLVRAIGKAERAIRSYNLELVHSGKLQRQLSASMQTLNDMLVEGLHKERIKELEVEMAIRGETNDLLAEKAQLEIKMLELSGKGAEAEAARHKEFLRQLRAERDAKKKAGRGRGRGRKEESAEDIISGFKPHDGGDFGEMEEAGLLRSLEGPVGPADMEPPSAFGRDEIIGASEARRRAQMDEIETLRLRIKTETDVMEREKLRAELEKTLHDRRLEQIEKEVKAREQAEKRQMRMLMTSIDATGQMISSHANAVALFATSERKRELATKVAEGGVILAHAIRAQVQAAIAFANLNIPQGLALQAAAIFGYAKAASLGVQGGGGSVNVDPGLAAGGSGFGGGGGGGLPGGSSRGGTGGSGTPEAPVSRPSGGSPPPPPNNGGGGNTVMVNVKFQSVLPADERKAGTKIRQLIRDSSRDFGNL